MRSSSYNFRYIASISFVAALGGLLFGYDWVVVGGAKPFYEQYFNIASSPGLQGWAISSALVGCVLGAIISGFLSKKYGRRSLLIVAAALFLLSAIGTGAAKDFTEFIIYRIIGGVGIGLAASLSPIYIAELSPANIRGKFVSINQLTIVVGILLAQIVNWLIAGLVSDTTSSSPFFGLLNQQNVWRFMFWAEAIPASLFFLFMWFIPDSPRWLILKGRMQAATNILKKIGGETYAKNTKNEIYESIQSEETSLKKINLLDKNIFPIVLIGIVLAAFQQWCGINIIFLYAEEVFTSAGYTVSGMLFNVIIVGSVNLVFTLIAMFLVDKIGRRTMLLVGSAGLSIIYLLIGIFYFEGVKGLPLLILIVMAIACYALTLAPVVWVVLSEMFPNKIRGAAMAAATFSLWVSNTLLVLFFPIVNKQISTYGSFWLFAAISILGFFFIYFKVKETKGKSLEEIEKEWSV